jgi:hypothetical protein
MNHLRDPLSYAHTGVAKSTVLFMEKEAFNKEIHQQPI